MKSKEIVFFSDLEGTLLREDGQFDEENFYKFGQELQKLADETKADISIVIVSPVGPTYLTQIMKKMDKSLYLIETRNSNKENNVEIKAAAGDFRDMSFDINERIDRRIDELSGVRSIGGALGNDAKLNYVSKYIQTKEEHASMESKPFYIYAGNGENDIGSMKFVNKLKNGLTITPVDATPNAKKAAKIKSNLSGIVGIADCIKQIRTARLEKENEFLDKN